MINLLEDLKSYLKYFFSNDKIYKDIKIVEANLYNNKLESDQITIFIQNEFEDTRYSTLDNAEINNVAVQFNCYSSQKNIDNEKRTSYYMSALLSDLVSKAFDKNVLMRANKNIKGCRKVMTTQPMPLKEGSQIYVTVIRFQLLVEYDYQK